MATHYLAEKKKHEMMHCYDPKFTCPAKGLAFFSLNAQP